MKGIFCLDEEEHGICSGLLEKENKKDNETLGMDDESIFLRYLKSNLEKGYVIKRVKEKRYEITNKENNSCQTFDVSIQDRTDFVVSRNLDCKFDHRIFVYKPTNNGVWEARILTSNVTKDLINLQKVKTNADSIAIDPTNSQLYYADIINSNEAEKPDGLIEAIKNLC